MWTGDFYSDRQWHSTGIYTEVLHPVGVAVRREPGPCIAGSFKISQLTAGLPRATYRARSPANSTHGTPAARTNDRRNPGQFTVAATS